MSKSKIIILAAAAVILLALGAAVFYFGFIGDAAKPLINLFPGNVAKTDKHLSPDEAQQADLSSQKDILDQKNILDPKDIFDPAYYIPELGRTYKYSFIDDGEQHEILVEWSKENDVYSEYSDYPSFSFFSENKYELTGGKLVIPQEIHGWYESEYLMTDYEGEYVFLKECRIGERWECSYSEPAFENEEWSIGYTRYKRTGGYIGIDNVVISGEKHPAFHIRADITVFDEEQTVTAQVKTDYWIVEGYGLVRSLSVNGEDKSETVLDGYEGFAE